MQYLKNFYKNVFGDIKIKWIFYRIEFWIFITAVLFTILFPEDKYFFLIAATVIYLLYKLYDHMELQRKKAAIEMYDADIPNILDSIIQEAFNEYFLYNKGYEKDKEYINAEEEQKILRIMVDNVSARLSESTTAKLEAYYNKDMVPDIISSKIYMAITSYVSQNNTPIKDQPDKLLSKLTMEDSYLEENSPEIITRYL